MNMFFINQRSVNIVFTNKVIAKWLGRIRRLNANEVNSLINRRALNSERRYQNFVHSRGRRKLPIGKSCKWIAKEYSLDKRVVIFGLIGFWVFEWFPNEQVSEEIASGHLVLESFRTPMGRPTSVQMVTASSSHLNLETKKPWTTSIKPFRIIIKPIVRPSLKIFWPLSSGSRNAKTSPLPSARFHASYELREPVVSSTKRSLSHPYVAMFKQSRFSLPFLETLAFVSSTGPSWPFLTPFLQSTILTPKKGC